MTSSQTVKSTQLFFFEFESLQDDCYDGAYEFFDEEELESKQTHCVELFCQIKDIMKEEIQTKSEISCSNSDEDSTKTSTQYIDLLIQRVVNILFEDEQKQIVYCKGSQKESVLSSQQRNIYQQ